MGSDRPSTSGRQGPSSGGWERLRILVPGWTQWGWRQPERALVLFGSFASAMAVGLFTWGTWGSVLLLAFAFGTHVTSAADVIRQGAFPGFGRVVPWASASFGLGLGCYAPALAMASVLAWPAMRPDASLNGHLINRWAYSDREPAPGEWACLNGAEGRGPGVARVVATAGQAVEWVDGRLRLDGQAPTWAFEPSGAGPRELAFEVPEGYILVAPEAPDAGEAPCGLRLVPRRRVIGRAWARLYPIWSRRLLR